MEGLGWAAGDGRGEGGALRRCRSGRTRLRIPGGANGASVRSSCMAEAAEVKEAAGTVTAAAATREAAMAVGVAMAEARVAVGRAVARVEVGTAAAAVVLFL